MMQLAQPVAREQRFQFTQSVTYSVLAPVFDTVLLGDPQGAVPELGQCPAILGWEEM